MPATADALLEARALTVAYPSRPVLSDVSLCLAPGELVALLGVNGAGKSTLLRACAGLIEPRSGELWVGGQPLARIPRRQLARRLSLLPQEYVLDLPFSAADVVMMGRYPHTRGLPTDEDARAAEVALQRCDVWDLQDRRFDSLSGGERRRVLLAQALCQSADLMLFDEPTASLDPAHQLAAFSLLREEASRRGAAVLVATHDLNLPARFCDRLVVLHRGRLIGDGPPEEILRGPALAGALGVPLHVGTMPTGALFVVPQ